jgi:hypothetical protein
LEAVKSGGGKLTRHEEQVLEGLQKELRAVKKARDALGDDAPKFREQRDGRTGGVLGKRRRDDVDQSTDDEDVPEDVKNIPMPRDTPPPIPKEILDKWYAKRRARRNADNRGGARDGPNKESAPPTESKTVYEAKPLMRDLRKEATSAFVPTAVRMKLDKAKGQSGGALMEPEEADQLEKEGYLKSRAEEEQRPGPQRVAIEDVEDEDT